jgi:serine phosphatase RsbU (regulator of sigma subunit)
MTQIFISHVSEDGDLAGRIATYVEALGYTAWYYERNSVPGPSYLLQTGQAIANSSAVILVISPAALRSANQMTKEIVRGHETGKPFIPLLLDIDHRDFQEQQPEWNEAIGAATTIQIPAEGLDSILPRVGDGLKSLGGGLSIQRIQDAQRSTPQVTFASLIEKPEAFIHKRVGPFTVREFIGRGGSGLVYRVFNATLGKQMCLKLLYPLKTHLGRATSVIANGVRGVAALQHPNIVQVYDFAPLQLFREGSYYLVMEYIRGKALDEWSREIAPTAIDARFRVALTITSALEAAHACRYSDADGIERSGVFHGDLKPANILVRDDCSPVVLDFAMLDIQRLLDPTIAPAEISEPRGRITPITSEAFGTPGFMAPEQEGEGVVNAKTDIYGLGKTLYELFFPEVLRAPGLRSSGLESLLRSMTSVHPDSRPRDMKVIFSILSDIASRLGVQLASTDLMELNTYMKTMLAEWEQGCEKNLRPGQFPRSEYLDVAAKSVPAEEQRGLKDFYDVIALSNKRIGILLGETFGRGPAATMRALSLTAAFRALARLELPLSQLFQHINKMMLNQENSYAVLCYGIIDQSGQFEYVNAGMNFFVIRNNSKIEMPSEGSIPVGLVDDATFQSGNMRLAPGDSVAMFTEGFREVEDADGTMFANTGFFEKVLASCSDSAPQDQLARLLSSVIEFSGGRPQQDEMTALVLRFRMPDEQASKNF